MSSKTVDIAPKNDTEKPEPLPFVLFHIAGFAAIWTGVSWQALALCLAFYVLRMWGVTAGYHRYFAHRSYHTSRIFQFVLAFVAQMSAQRGALWWAATHRAHHRHSDTELDVHSPAQRGFWYAHLGWIFDNRHHATDYGAISDFAKFPELVWLDRNPYVPPATLAVAAFLIGGWQGLVVGFVWSTILTFHATFFINSLAHVHGKRRFVTGDQSRNNWLLALITLGEGWHNNHHAFPSSARQGFRWWEIDLTYCVLKGLSLIGVVWDLRPAPQDLRQGRQTVAPVMIERAAAQLVGDFAARLAKAKAEWRIPSLEELRKLAASRLPKTPQLDEIIERAMAIARSHVAVRVAVAAD